MNIKKHIKKTFKKRPIAITASILIIVMTTFTTSNEYAWAVVAILVLISYHCWHKLGLEQAWYAKKVIKDRIYRYYGSADHVNSTEPNLNRLLLGALRITCITHGNDYYETEITDKKYNPGMYEVDVLTDELIVGEKYYGDILVRNSKVTTTLRRVREK